MPTDRSAGTPKRFFSVSTVDTPDDDRGCTVTFATREEAERFREWALGQGHWHVSPIW